MHEGESVITGGHRFIAATGGKKPFGMSLPEIRIDEDIFNIRIDTLLNITIDHYPVTGVVTPRTGGGKRIFAR